MGLDQTTLCLPSESKCCRTLKCYHWDCCVADEYLETLDIALFRREETVSTCTRHVKKAHRPLYSRCLLLCLHCVCSTFISFPVSVILQNWITYMPKNFSDFEKFNTINIYFWKLYLWWHYEKFAIYSLTHLDKLKFLKIWNLL